MSTFAFALGRIASEVTVRQAAGKDVADFRIDAGPGFYSCSAWGELAGQVASLAQGTLVAITGRLNTRTFEGKNGRQTIVSIVASTVEVIGAGAPIRPAAAMAQGQRTPPQRAANLDDEDLFG